jgi:hypothetical protein
VKTILLYVICRPSQEKYPQFPTKKTVKSPCPACPVLLFKSSNSPLPFQFFYAILFPQLDKETGTLAQILYTKDYILNTNSGLIDNWGFLLKTLAVNNRHLVNESG